jgi:DNA invertase Pin-like site-specific DNA recombinase
MKAVIYSRVSLQIQEYHRQTTELMEHAKKRGVQIVECFEEKASGMKADRPELLSMMSKVHEMGINQVWIHELSRIGRNPLQVMATIEELHKAGIGLYIHNIGLETLVNNQVNPMASFMVNILSSVAHMERQSIRNRMNSGFQHYIKAGGKVGRKQGQGKDEQVFISENANIIRLLKQGHSVRNVAKICDKSTGTVMKCKRYLENEKK